MSIGSLADEHPDLSYSNFAASHLLAEMQWQSTARLAGLWL